ncbi:glycerol-3-phosphate 1-O-acyltransferase PlsY [Candidatus Saganbacteria bacterium]|nr:glycerol-3-phosphate 1-O-acyltransferase PlsY [Candidatus Saganbacteria bacterium]
MMLIILILLAYFMGSIPFGYFIPLIWQVDIRRHGSGNIGATNVFRTLGPAAGATVFALDMLKGTIPVMLANWFIGNPWLITMVAASAVLGHTFSIFMKFKGGRGAATGLGILLGLAPDIFLIALIVGLLIIIVTRYVSVASMATPILVTLAFISFGRPLAYTLVAALISLIIILRHQPNIKRLRAGTEPKIGMNNVIAK